MSVLVLCYGKVLIFSTLFFGQTEKSKGGLIETGGGLGYRGIRYSPSQFLYQFRHNSKCLFSHPAKASKRRKMWRVTATPTATSRSFRNGP